MEILVQESTTAARILGNILFKKSYQAEEIHGIVIPMEATMSNSLKTREVLESALGGVLYHEAYTLHTGLNDDFGKDALSPKFTEDHRRDIVIIFAGYTNE